MTQKALYDKFELLQRNLYNNKFYYYVLKSPIISDEEYDRLIEKSISLAKKLGFRADKDLGPESDEKDHVHWMVGCNEGSIYSTLNSNFSNKKMTRKIKTYKIAVYGSLRKGLSNHNVIGKSSSTKYLGEFDSKPIFSMYTLGEFPAIIMPGETSVKFEVYEVDEETFQAANRLEGFIKAGDPNNFYNRIQLHTPYGNCYIYTYNGKCNEGKKLDIGDWKEHYLMNKAVSC